MNVNLTGPRTMQNIARIWGATEHYDGKPVRRFWDMTALRRAIAVPSYEQMDAVVEALRTGKPLVVAALGSSLVSDFGGCYQPSLDEVYR
jgi:hypothetical protein